MPFTLIPIGTVQRPTPDRTLITLDSSFAAGLDGLDGFSHVVLTWWFSACAAPSDRAVRTVEQPYPGAPSALGVFATRSPQRPNPIALSVAQIIAVDHAHGTVEVGFCDADSGTPVLDIKPYTPSLDRVAEPRVPGWAARWPLSIEESATFDWGSIFAD